MGYYDLTETFTAVRDCRLDDIDYKAGDQITVRFSDFNRKDNLKESKRGEWQSRYYANYSGKMLARYAIKIERIAANDAKTA